MMPAERPAWVKAAGAAAISLPDNRPRTGECPDASGWINTLNSAPPGLATEYDSSDCIQERAAVMPLLSNSRSERKGVFESCKLAPATAERL
jgi:hypothetical protein